MPDQEPQPHGGASELASFGEELRREREIRGISLKEIADATKISRRFLEAIERNDHRTLPAPVFTRGFVREYARYLGLNSDEIVNRYNQAAANDDRIEKPPAIARYPEVLPKDIAPRPRPKRGIPPAWAAVDRNAVALLFIAAALAAVAWWAVQHRRLERMDAPPLAAAPVVATKSDAPAPAPAPVASPVQDDGVLRLSVTAQAGSWVVLEADGATVLNAEMAAGDTKTFEAKQQFRFRTIGNAGGLNLTLNGLAVPALGADGDVIHDRVFNQESLEQLRNPGSAPATDAGATEGTAAAQQSMVPQGDAAPPAP